MSDPSTALLVLEVVEVFAIGGLTAAALLLKQTLPSYLAEKGKNLATREDIEVITQKVEAVRAAVGKELHQFTTQFSRLDQQRAEGVMQIHGSMCDIETLLIVHAGSAVTARISSEPEARTMRALNKAWEEVWKLNHVLNYRSLLLNERVYERVQAWSIEVIRVIAAVGNEVEPLRRDPARAQRSIDERETALDTIRGKHLNPGLVGLGGIRRELEQEFRAILGGGGA